MRAMIWAALWCAAALSACGPAAAQLRPEDAPDPPPPPPHANHTRCGDDCIRCDVEGCVKCAGMLVWPEGRCARECPAGTRGAWARDDRLMGRVCYPTLTYNEILVGSACGVAVCLVLVACGACYARFRARPRLARPLPQPPPQEDDAKLRDFHKQLDCLRPHAYTLLAILNHTRGQVRELYQLGNNDAAVAYSCVLSDLAKLLILLNKKHVPVVPDEWPRLASWAERILKRYNHTSGDVETVGQLVNLQSSSSQSSDSEHTHSFSTFKPPSYSPTSYDSNIIDKELDSRCEWSDVGRPPSYSQIERETIVLAGPWVRRPVVRRESVWLEDENFELTRRPQDELTTEL